jgi:hemerythrin-like metal-binding protein
MPYLTWDDKTMSVGVGVLDDDHKKLVALIDNLFFGLKDGRDKDATDKMLDKVVAHAVEHFNREEAFFEKTGYPDADVHMTAHKNLAKQILVFQQRYKKEGTDALALEIANFLWTWLVCHDLTFDKKYGPYLNSKGVF